MVLARRLPHYGCNANGSRRASGGNEYCKHKKIGGYYVTSNEFKKLVTHHV